MPQKQCVLKNRPQNYNKKHTRKAQNFTMLLMVSQGR